jgi:diguanylate cyclase (GGDEF)-like protein
MDGKIKSRKEYIDTIRDTNLSDDIQDSLIEFYDSERREKIRMRRERNHFRDIDNKTSLYNSKKFSEVLEAEVKRVNRYGGELTVIFADIDKFKPINDTYGHSVGDEILNSIGKIINEEKRDVDIAARYGGEEFAIILPQTNAEESVKLATRISYRINEEYIDEPHVTMSFGIADMTRETNLSHDDILKRADEAMYKSKMAGRDRITVFGKEPIGID